MGSMSFPVTKPPEIGGFDEQYSGILVRYQSKHVTKPPETGGFVTQ